MIVAGMAAGALWGFIPGILKAHYSVNEVISTLMLNYIAIQWVRFWVFGPWSEGGFQLSKQFPREAWLPRLTDFAKLNSDLGGLTTHLGFVSHTTFLPAFADVRRGNLRLLLSGPASSAGRAMPDGRTPGPGGWNRIHVIVGDITAEVTRLRAAGVEFRSDIVTGPGGKQIVLDDPAGNPVELFQPAGP